MENGIETRTLKSKEVVALKILAITAIPHISILKSDNESVREIASQNDDNLKRLISEIYQIYKGKSDNIQSSDMSLELLWKTKEVESQTYKANIDLYFVIRALAKTEREAITLVEEISVLCCSALNYQKYDFSEVSFKEFNEELLSVDKSSTSAIIKDDNTVEFKLCGNVFENETEIMYFLQKSVEVATHLSKSFSVAYTANPQQNIYFFLWTFK